MDNKMTAEQALERFRQDLLPDPHDEHDIDASWIRRRWEKYEPAIRAALSAPRVPDIASMIDRFDDTEFVSRHGNSIRQCMAVVNDIDLQELRDLVVGYWGVANKLLAASLEPVSDDAQQVIADLRAEVEALKAKLVEWAGEAYDDVGNWAVYASQYFQDKHGLSDDLDKWAARKSGNGIDAARLREGGE